MQQTSTPPNVIEKTLQDDLGAIYYRYAISKSSRSPVITLISGYSRTHSDMKLWQKKISKLGMNVLICDLRGSGRSIAYRPFDFSQWIKDILTIWNDLEIKESHLLGFSMGGVIAQGLALEQAAKKCVLISTLANPKHFAYIPNQGAKSVLDQQPLWHPLEAYFSKKFHANNPQICDLIKQSIVQIATSEIGRQQTSYQRKAFAEAAYPKLTTPQSPKHTLIIHGHKDSIVSVQAAYDMHEQIQPSTLKIYPDCGHLLLLEQPRQLYHDITEFLLSPLPC